MDNTERKASELVQRFLDTLNISDTKGYSSFFLAWNSIVGLEFCGHCKPADVRKGILVVEVDHPGWQQKFRMNEKHFLKEVKTQFPQLGIKRFSYIYRDNAIFKKPVKKEPEAKPDSPNIAFQSVGVGTEDKVLHNAKEKIEDSKKELPPDLQSVLDQLKKSLSEEK